MSNGDTGKQITDLEALSSLSNDDLFLLRDISDLTSAIKEKKVTLSTLKSFIGGLDFSLSMADFHQDLTFIVSQRNHSALYTFVPGASPEARLGNRAVSRLVGSQAAVGTGGDNLPAGIGLLSNNKVVYLSTMSKRVKNIWLGSVEHSVNTIRINGDLGGEQVIFSDISPELPSSGDWTNVKFEFSDGTFLPVTTESTPVTKILNKSGLISFLDLEEFSPNKANIYPSVKQIFKAGSNITLTPSDSNNEITIESSGSPGGATFNPTQANIYPVTKLILRAGANVNVTPNDANDEVTIAAIQRDAFEPSKTNIYDPVKAILKAGSNITLTPNDTNNEVTLEASDSKTDITEIETEVNRIKDEITYDSAPIRGTAVIRNANWIDMRDSSNNTISIDRTKQYKLSVGDFGQQKFNGADVDDKDIGTAGGAVGNNNSISITGYTFGPSLGIVVRLGKSATGAFLISIIDVDGQAEVGDLDFTLEETGFIVDDWALKNNSSQIPASQIPNLDAAKITTGILNVLRIPNLDAAKIVSGVLNAARIPDIAGSKVTIDASGFGGSGKNLATTDNTAQKVAQKVNDLTITSNGQQPTLTTATLTGHQFEADLSLAETDLNVGTAQKVNIAARAGVTEAGVTIANNELTFVTAGMYEVFATFKVKGHVGTGRDAENNIIQNSRTIMRTFANHIRGSTTAEILESDASGYIRAVDDASVAGTVADWGQLILHTSFAYKMNAGDKISLNLEPMVEQQAGNTWSLDTGSIVEVVWHSITGIKGDKGEPGNPGSGVSTYIGLTDTESTYAGQKGKVSRVKTDETGQFFSNDIEEIETDINRIKNEINKYVQVFTDQSVNHINENFYRFSPTDPTLDSTKIYNLTVKLGNDSFGQQKFDAGPLLLKTPSTVGTVPTNANSITLKFTDSINEYIEVKLGHDSSGKLLVGGLDGTFVYSLSETLPAWDGLGRTDESINTLIDSAVEPLALKKNPLASPYFKINKGWVGTEAQLQALPSDDDSDLYFIPSTE